MALGGKRRYLERMNWVGAVALNRHSGPGPFGAGAARGRTMALGGKRRYRERMNWVEAVALNRHSEPGPFGVGTARGR